MHAAHGLLNAFCWVEAPDATCQAWALGVAKTLPGQRPAKGQINHCVANTPIPQGSRHSAGPSCDRLRKATLLLQHRLPFFAAHPSALKLMQPMQALAMSPLEERSTLSNEHFAALAPGRGPHVSENCSRGGMSERPKRSLHSAREAGGLSGAPTSPGSP